MRTSNSLCKHHRNVDALQQKHKVKFYPGNKRTKVYLNFGAVLHVSVLGNGIRNDHRLETGVVYPVYGRSGEDAVRKDGVHLGGAGFCQFFGRMTNCAAGVCHVVDQNGHSILHVTDQNHGRDFVGLLTFLVDQGELDVQSVRYGGDTLGTASVRRHDNASK